MQGKRAPGRMPPVPERGGLDLEERRGEALLAGLELGTQSPIQLWRDHTLYLERCDRVLAFGEGYLRFQVGRCAMTLLGGGLQVDTYSGGRLLVRGKFSALEFG